jgi:hypothetical protein
MIGSGKCRECTHNKTKETKDSTTSHYIQCDILNEATNKNIRL